MAINLERIMPPSVATPVADAYFAPLAALLRDLDALLAAVGDAQYVQKPVGVIPSSLGGHVRHCLDHVEALLAGIDSDTIDYDRRARGTTVENDRKAACAAIQWLCERLTELDVCVADRPVHLTALTTADGDAVQVGSTIGRELVFVLSHTIHHNALIAAMCRTLGIPLSARFGYAPATIAHLEEATCAR